MTEQNTDLAVVEHVHQLREGVEALRSAVDTIDRHKLVDLVANWIDAEALLWETAGQFVDLLASINVQSPDRGGEIRFGTDTEGNLRCQLDTSEHAKKIILLATSEERQ
ncbi:hypothetical protein PP512_gp69 [Gordonia phage Denise]|uniref:Uncharacterized protein n=1 Tax=Gordonia phage Denise TaxID=2652879 RepID=A0A5P8DCF9_9CAUD|nr:hypothetical protein PP512_gp69 [Gordonia phage Denise]QFP96684.1 hypothetical protein SEA_DENISE_69 [Gordonia phage Denise]